MTHLAHRLEQRGLLPAACPANLMLGFPNGAAANARSLVALLDGLPESVTAWHAGAFGAFQQPAGALAAAMGGHVRTGLEDNPYLDRIDRAPATNAELVERAALQARAVGRVRRGTALGPSDPRPRRSRRSLTGCACRLTSPGPRLHIAGTGSFAAEVIEFAHAAAFAVAGLVEPIDPARIGGEAHGLPVLDPAAPPLPRCGCRCGCRARPRADRQQSRGRRLDRAGGRSPVGDREPQRDDRRRRRDRAARRGGRTVERRRSRPARTRCAGRPPLNDRCRRDAEPGSERRRHGHARRGRDCRHERGGDRPSDRRRRSADRRRRSCRA